MGEGEERRKRIWVLEKWEGTVEEEKSLASCIGNPQGDKSDADLW